jgi:hypothetical protein
MAAGGANSANQLAGAAADLCFVTPRRPLVSTFRPDLRVHSGASHPDGSASLPYHARWCRRRHDSKPTLEMSLPGSRNTLIGRRFGKKRQRSFKIIGYGCQPAGAHVPRASGGGSGVASGCGSRNEEIGISQPDCRGAIGAPRTLESVEGTLAMLPKDRRPNCSWPLRGPPRRNGRT